MDGILVINKPAGMTSHDVVFKLRKILNTRKIGHSGTLDPNATGVLLVLVGKATKILPFIEDIDKEYIASIELGKKTLTDDVWGEVLEIRDVKPIHNFDEILQSFQGEIKQTPPIVSSIKVNGKKLYEYARSGEPVELPVRDVEIFNIEAIDNDKLIFKTHCSSGTYIRSLCVDIADKSGNLGCMSTLVRTKVGRFDLEKAQALDILNIDNAHLYSIDEMLAHLPQIEYKPIENVYHGKKIQLDTQANRVCIVEDKKCVAIYDRVDETTFKSTRGLW